MYDGSSLQELVFDNGFSDVEANRPPLTQS